jgi:hypothetical protein
MTKHTRILNRRRYRYVGHKVWVRLTTNHGKQKDRLLWASALSPKRNIVPLHYTVSTTAQIVSTSFYDQAIFVLKQLGVGDLLCKGTTQLHCAVASFTTAKELFESIGMYCVLILSDNYRLSFPVATQPRVWAVRWVNQRTESGNR